MDDTTLLVVGVAAVFGIVFLFARIVANRDTVAAGAMGPTGWPSVPQGPVMGSALEKYSVIYRGGLPTFPKGRPGLIDFYVLPDSFALRPTAGSKSWFPGLIVPYASVTSFEIAQRQVSTFEGLLGGLDSRQLNQPNNIHIGLRWNGLDLLLRLEMISGITVMGQAGKCRELVDRLRVHGILGRIAGPQAGVPLINASDVVDETVHAAPQRTLAYPASVPATALTPVVVSPSIEARLATLEHLRTTGAITEEEYAARRTKILDDL